MNKPMFSPCGPNRFESDLEAMTGRSLNWYWKAMWGFVSPLLIIGLFIFYLSDYIITAPLQYQAWDATQVPDIPAGLGNRAEPMVTSEHREPLLWCGEVTGTSSRCFTDAQIVQQNGAVSG